MRVNKLVKAKVTIITSEVSDMNFILVKDPEIAKKLLDMGFEMLTQSNECFIFKNDLRKSASFGHFRGVVFSNTMFF